MKVYQINVVCGNGSTGRIATDIARTVCECGGRSRIAYGRGNDLLAVDSIRIESKLGVYFHVLMTRMTGRHGLYSKRATKKLIADIRKYNPDIIHLHNIHGYYVNYEMLFCFLREYNRPIVWTLHDCWSFTGHCAHFSYAGCNKWTTGCEECVQTREYPATYGVDSSKRNYLLKRELLLDMPNLTIVTVSNWLQSVAKHSFLKSHPMQTIYNGIDLDKYCAIGSELRKKHSLQEKKIVLGVSSVWSKKKGIDTFVQLAERLPKNICIVMIGVPQKQQKKMPQNILYVDKLADVKALCAWYTAADIYLNASLEETMGLTTVEALACGTPVIVMNATACPEVVTEGSGVVVEPGDIEGLIQAIYRVEKTEDVSKACIERAGAFEMSKQYRKYVKTYENLIAGKE